MKSKKFIAFLLVFIMCFSFISFSNTTKAETNSEDIVFVQTCVVDGVEWTLTMLYDNDVYLQIGKSEPMYITFSDEVKFDKYGTIWFKDGYTISWWNYNLTPDDIILRPIRRPTDLEPNAYVNDVESFVLETVDGKEFVSGYTTVFNGTHLLLSYDEMKNIIETEKISKPSPSPTSVPTLRPTATPTVPGVKPSTDPTVNSTATPKFATTPKVSIKKKSGYTCLSVGNEVVSKYKLKKGVLTWKGIKKSQNIKQVKQAGFIRKSKNLVYITKKGKAYTISQKGKKRTILKKGAKKLIFMNGYVSKIKKKSGYMNVVNK